MRPAPSAVLIASSPPLAGVCGPSPSSRVVSSSSPGAASERAVSRSAHSRSSIRARRGSPDPAASVTAGLQQPQVGLHSKPLLRTRRRRETFGPIQRRGHETRAERGVGRQFAGVGRSLRSLAVFPRGVVEFAGRGLGTGGVEVRPLAILNPDCRSNSLR